MDVSVTEANLNNASFQWGCNLATYRSVFVQLCLQKAHLFSGVEGHIQSVTEAKEKGLGAGPLRAPTILNCRRMMAKQSLFSHANSVLLQALKKIRHRTKFCKRFKLCFGIIMYSEDIDKSISHKLAGMTRLAGAIRLSSLSTQSV